MKSRFSANLSKDNTAPKIILHFTIITVLMYCYVDDIANTSKFLLNLFYLQMTLPIL